MRFCPNCGAPRVGDAPFCASCGQLFDGEPSPRPERRRNGNHASTGFSLALIGAGALFIPFFRTDYGNISIWQSHDLCSSFLGGFAIGSCSTVAWLWAGCLGVLGLGILVIFAALLRSDSEPRQSPPRRAPKPFVPQPPAPPPAAMPPPAIVLPPAVAAESVARTSGLLAAPEARLIGRVMVPPTTPRAGIDGRSLGIGAAIAGAATLVIVAVILLTAVRPGPSVAKATDLGVLPTLTPTVVPTASPTPRPPAVVDVPVIACATVYGNGEVQQPTEPSERLTLPGALSDRVAVFATNADRVMGPRDARCVADVGGNSTAILTVSYGQDSTSAVILEDGSVSYGTVLELACPLFPEAARLGKELGEPCPTPLPDETIIKVSATVVRFDDPSGVAGVGTGSGGKNPAFGAIQFTGGDEHSATKITCILPYEDREVCETIVDDWLRRISTSTP